MSDRKHLGWRRCCLLCELYREAPGVPWWTLQLESSLRL
jgi:hypothetical protein